MTKKTSTQNKPVKPEDTLLLNKEESAIAELIAQGYDHDEIIKIRGISKATFYRYQREIYNKLKIENDVQLTLLLHRLGKLAIPHRKRSK